MLTEIQVQELQIFLFFKTALGTKNPCEFSAADFATWQDVTKATALKRLKFLVGQGVLSVRVATWRENAIAYRFTMTETALDNCKRSILENGLGGFFAAELLRQK